MPTEYFIETTKEAEEFVDKSDINNITLYIKTPRSNIESDDPHRCAMPQSMKPLILDDMNLRIYHILSYAVDIGNINVIKYVMDNFKYDTQYTPHGNAYSLIVLAIQNWIRNKKREKREKTDWKPETFYQEFMLKQENELTKTSSEECYDIILTLLKYGFGIPYALRFLIDYCEETDDYELVDILLRKYKLDSWDIYHYSIFWCRLKVFDYMVEHYSDLINFSCTKNSVKMIETHGSKNKDMMSHVFDKLENMGIKYS